MTNEQAPTPVPRNAVLESLCNLTMRALMGEYPDPDQLRNQCMRIYRGVEYAPVEGKNWRIVIEDTATKGMMNYATDLAPTPIPGDGLEAHTTRPDVARLSEGEIVKELEGMDGFVHMVAVKRGPCPRRRQHAHMKRRREACPECGFNLPILPTSDLPSDEPAPAAEG